MVDLRKKAITKAQAQAQVQASARQKPEPKMLYNMRCIPCSEGHRLCDREVPCKTCTSSRRDLDCQYPAKARLVEVEPEESEEEYNVDDEDDMVTFQKTKERGQHDDDVDMEDPEILEAEQVVPMGSSPASSPPQPMLPSEISRHTNAWTVQMHFARAQVLHMAEAMRADPTIGFINPRIRPDLDPNHPTYTGLTIGPQPRILGNDSLGSFDNHRSSNEYVGEDMGIQNAGEDLDNQYASQDLEGERDINEVGAGDLLDDMINEGNNENGGLAEQIDFSGPEHDGFNVQFEGFTNNGRYTLANASLEHCCMESRANGHECYNPCTFPCEEDHTHMTHNPHHVCHDCRVQGDFGDVGEEEVMISNFRIYFCADCTTRRATGPDKQMWTHPRRFAELKTRKVNKCSCHDALQKGWICGHHRAIRSDNIERWGPEKLKSFRNFFGGNFCADCRVKPPQSDGAVVMWQCAMCDDFVLQE